MTTNSTLVENATGRRKLLNIEETAEYLNVSARFVRDRRSDGQLPAIKLGGLLRFDPDDLDRYIDACRELLTPVTCSERSSLQ